MGAQPSELPDTFPRRLRPWVQRYRFRIQQLAGEVGVDDRQLEVLSVAVGAALADLLGRYPDLSAAESASAVAALLGAEQAQ